MQGGTGVKESNRRSTGSNAICENSDLLVREFTFLPSQPRKLLILLCIEKVHMS